MMMERSQTCLLHTLLLLLLCWNFSELYTVVILRIRFFNEILKHFC